jgi:hypothetical protein
VKRQEEWQPVLDAELKRWEAKPWQRLISELTDEQCYEVALEFKKYQVEVQLLENTDTYVHVGVSVDGGSLPASLRPLSSSFIRKKTGSV